LIEVFINTKPKELRAMTKKLTSKDLDLFAATPMTAAQAAAYLTAGKATLTLQSLRTGVHYTYRVTAVESPRSTAYKFFVSLLTAPDVYTYIGMLGEAYGASDRLAFVMTKKSQLPFPSAPIQAFCYFLNGLAKNRIAPELEVRLEGKCGVCARPLTHPESLNRGIGPECWDRVGGFVCKAERG
jgi:hypothetical protein